VEYSLAIAHGGSLPFPVEAASQRDIGSRFGTPRGFCAPFALGELFSSGKSKG
jgi:hypothetical protein